jgi:hypothetical protein
LQQSHAQEAERFAKQNCQNAEWSNSQGKTWHHCPELFSYAADQLSFVEEKIATDAYLGTAPLIILDGLLGVGAKPRSGADPRRLSRHQQFEQQRAPTCLPWIFQPVSIPIQARQIATA